MNAPESTAASSAATVTQPGIARPYLLIAVLLAAALVRLWIVSVQPVRAMYPLPHDDELYVNLADYLIQGQWLGPYDQMTLAKGPMLPILIALAYFLGVPFVLAWQALYSIACIACACAIDATTGRRRFAAWAGVALLANPMSYDGSEMTQMLRQNVFTPFALLLLAATLALAWSRRPGRLYLALWSICWGVSAAGYYLTREETIWLVPSIAILLAGLGGGRGTRRARALAFGGGLLLAACVIAAVAWMNLRHYGWFTTTELRAREFRRAYAAVTAVSAGEPVRFVPVSSASLAQLCRNVESFALLEPHLEHGTGPGWRLVSREALPSLRGTSEIGGGWFIWALRDAVAEAGFHSSGRAAADFYRRLGDEIRAACAEGRIDCSNPGLAYATGLRPEYARPLARNFLRATAFMATFEDFSADVTPSMGNAWSQARYRDITGSPVAPLAGSVEKRATRTSVLSIAGVAHRYAMPLLLAGTLPIWIVALRRGKHKGEGAPTFAIAASALVATLTLAGIVALIETTSFGAITIRYLHSAYPMMILYVVASISVAGTILPARR